MGAFIVDDGGAAIAGAVAAAANGTVNASAPLPYDEDTWVWMPTDWYESPASELMPAYMAPGGGDEPIPDAILVNGRRTDGVTLVASRGTRQLVRVVNAAAMSMFRVSVDGLPLTLVELDGTACEPLDVPFVDLNVAQRAAVILDWSRLHADVASSPALWFRVSAMPTMYWSYDPSSPDLGLYGSTTRAAFQPHWRGLIRFEEDAALAGAAAQPNYTAAPALALLAPADSLNLMQARSWPPAPAPDATHSAYVEVAVAFDGDYVRRGLINGASMPLAAMGAQLAPPALYAYGSRAGGPLSDDAAPLTGALRGAGDAPFVLPLGAVVELTINNTDRGEHPFHLHGHDFWVVATSAAPGAAAQYGPHFVRRDVVSVPAFGWARVRFVADNPGVWLLHCRARPRRRIARTRARICVRELAPQYVLTVCVALPPSQIWTGPSRARQLRRRPSLLGGWRANAHKASLLLLRRHMHIGMMATFVEAPTQMMRAAAAGTFAVPAAHLAACAAPLASNASAYTA